MLGNPATWKAQVREFYNHYRQDIPNIAGLDAELIMWERLWIEKRSGYSGQCLTGLDSG